MRLAVKPSLAPGSSETIRIAETADSAVSSSPPPSRTAAPMASTTSRPICSAPDADQGHERRRDADPEHDAGDELQRLRAALAVRGAEADDRGDRGERRAAVRAARGRPDTTPPSRRRRSGRSATYGRGGERRFSRPQVVARRTRGPALKAGPGCAPPIGGGLPTAAEVRDLGLLLLRLLLLGRLGRVRALAELDRERLGLAAAGDLHLDAVAGLVLVDERGQGAAVVDGLAAELGDDVADLQARRSRPGRPR